MTDQPASLAFAPPYAAAARQSTRAIAEGLRDNALAGLPPSAFEDMAVARSFMGRRQIILSDPAAIRHVLIENAENYGRTPSIYRLLDPAIGRGMLLADGEDWRGAARRPGGRRGRRNRPVRATPADDAGNRRDGTVLARPRRRGAAFADRVAGLRKGRRPADRARFHAAARLAGAALAGAPALPPALDGAHDAARRGAAGGAGHRAAICSR
jgi:hypothetical protein